MASLLGTVIAFCYGPTAMHVYGEQMCLLTFTKSCLRGTNMCRVNKAAENMTKKWHKCEESDRATQNILLKT